MQDRNGVLRLISVVIPTRGDVPDDIARIVEHLRTYPSVDDIYIAEGTTPFNRYRAIHEGKLKHELIWTQDDDCITDLEPALDRFEDLLANYQERFIVNSMTLEHAAQYPGDETLLGFGSIFHRCLVSNHGCMPCFDPFFQDSVFLRESDRIFGTMNPHITVFPKIEILPSAHNLNRLWKQPEHLATRDEMRRRVAEILANRRWKV